MNDLAITEHSKASLFGHYIEYSPFITHFVITWNGYNIVMLWLPNVFTMEFYKRNGHFPIIPW